MDKLTSDWKRMNRYYVYINVLLFFPQNETKPKPEDEKKTFL